MAPWNETLGSDEYVIYVIIPRLLHILFYLKKYSNKRKVQRPMQFQSLTGYYYTLQYQSPSNMGNGDLSGFSLNHSWGIK